MDTDIDITPFFKELARHTFSHIARVLLYMFFFAIGALTAFLYISEREERDISLEEEDHIDG